MDHRKYTDDKPLFLGGSNANDETTCLRTMSGNVQEIRLLKCDHEEADDRIMLHVNHAVTVESLRRIIVASADTDVFVCLMYHFNNNGRILTKLKFGSLEDKVP